MLIDLHCHFNTLSREKREEVSASIVNQLLIDSSIDLKTSLASVGFSKKHNFLYTSLGFHPFCADKFSEDILDKYRELIDQNPKVIAIGEIGLDSFAKVSITEQERALIKFLDLAKEKKLAIFIHNRMQESKGFNPVKILEVIDKVFSNYEKIIFHCFSYSKDLLSEVLKRKGFISFSLNVLRENKVIHSSLESCPLESIFLETDSPYMRIGNQESNPLDIDRVYSLVAQVKKIKKEHLEEAIYNNMRKVFPSIE